MAWGKRQYNDNRMAYIYSLSAHERMNEICSPLKKINISGFGYFKILPDGKYLHLTNGLTEFQRIYFQEINNLGIFETRFQKIPPSESRKLVWCLPKNFNHDKILYLSHQNGFIHGIDFYVRNGDSIENFYFILSNAKHSDPSCLLDKNYVRCLKDFMTYFKYQASDLIDCSEQQKLASYSKPIDISYKPNTEISNQIMDFKKILYKDECLVLVDGETYYLTKREQDIMELIHKNSKEIAANLDISYKTVEGYIEKLRDKLGVNLKSSLIDISINNKLLKSTLKR